MSSLEKLYQAVVVRNDQPNLQPTLNKGPWGAGLTIFVTDCLENFEKGFLKTQKFFFWKISPSLTGDYIAMFIS